MINLTNDFINKKLNWETEKEYTKRIEQEVQELKDTLEKYKRQIDFQDNRIEKLQKENEELKDKCEFECTCWNNELKVKDSKIEKLQKISNSQHIIIKDQGSRLLKKDHEWEQKIKDAIKNHEFN